MRMLELGCWDEVLSTISSSHSTNCSFGLFGRRGSNLTRVSWTTERWDCKKTPCHRSDCLILSLAGLGTDQCLSEICDQSH